ncbi:MAG: hypothetical protein K2X87_17350 [Gemmataceae bacterium]|nr:hypothetical protein [Gemmataceae bacterium]
MRYIVLGAVAAVALAVTAGTASAQHGVRHGHGYPTYSPAHGGSGFAGRAAAGHHQPGGHVVRPGGGFYAGPGYGGVGVVTGPSYSPAHPVGPGLGYSPGRGHGFSPHHGQHH